MEIHNNLYKAITEKLFLHYYIILFTIKTGSVNCSLSDTHHIHILMAPPPEIITIPFQL